MIRGLRLSEKREKISDDLQEPRAGDIFYSPALFNKPLSLVSVFSRNAAPAYPGSCLFLFMNISIRSTGMGKIMVEVFSVDISVSVCR